jgi:hypothetical protein
MTTKSTFPALGMSQSFQLRRFETAMAGKNHIGVVDDNRI